MGKPGKDMASALFEFSQLLLNETYLSRVSNGPNRESVLTTSSLSSAAHASQHYHAMLKSGVNASYTFSLLTQSATMGNPAAQAYLAATYATGVYLTLVPMDASSSILLQYMSALGGSVEGNMAMGYRHLYGLGVAESCDLALKHYEFAANQVVSHIEEKGYTMFIDTKRLSDTSGKSSSQRGHGGQMRREFDPEMMDYYQSLAEEGDWSAALTVSQVYYSGSRFIPQDQDKALKYLKIAAALDNPSARGILGYHLALQFGRNVTKAISDMTKPPVTQQTPTAADISDNTHTPPSTDKHTPVQSITTSNVYESKYTVNITLMEIMKDHLLYAYARGDPSAAVGLGYCHMRGLGFRRNLTMAIEYFKGANGE